MSIVVVTYLAYLLVSIGLTIAVGRALARNGRLFLVDVFGVDGPAEAISNLLVVAFYLINLGFVALTMRTAGDIGSARQAIQLLAAKVGEVLLVLGALYLANIVVLTRLRRRQRLQAPPASAPQARPPATADRPTAGLAAQALWRPAAQKAVP